MTGPSGGDGGNLGQNNDRVIHFRIMFICQIDQPSKKERPEQDR